MASLDAGGGIAYSVNDSGPINLQLLTKLKSLSETNWYYYEENDN